MRDRSPYAVLLLLLLLPLALLRRRRGPRASPHDAYGPPPPGSCTVRTDDGVDLHVEYDGLPAAPLTVLFVHGFTARLDEFDLQRAAVSDRAHVVLYDQRGHGRSHRGTVRNATIDQLGRDLAAVLEQAVRPGPVVLVGHSMGGMTIMSLARQFPELFGSRVVGAFLLATSSGGLVADGPAGLFVKVLRRLHLLHLWLLGLRLWSPVLERLRRPGTKLGRAYIRHYLFGRDDADPELVTRVQALLEETPVTVTARFYATLIEHEETPSLQVLRRVPVTVLVGDADRLTPVGHSLLMADELGPDAELVVVPGAGHSVNLTRPEVVDGALLRLLDRAESSVRRTA